MAIVTCYRAHGDPSFPDPVYDPSDGRWHFAISPGSAPASTQQACQHLFPSGNASPPVPQAQFQQLVRLAECLREHGSPNWPDPDPDGSFPLPSSINPKDPANQAAGRACQRYYPASGHIDVHARLLTPRRARARSMWKRCGRSRRVPPRRLCWPAAGVRWPWP